jgi:two-component system, OmpR family, response regulator RegX3
LVLIEDDVAVGEATVDLLSMYGYSVRHALTAQHGLAAVTAHTRLVLLDLGLPDLDGLEVCRRLRASSNVAIVAISARSDEMDKVLALRAGADDYIVKPYGAQELLARIEAVLRRSSRSEIARPELESVRLVVSGRCELDPAAHRCWVDNTELPLTRKEFAVLELLATRAGNVVKREDLLRLVWGEEWSAAHRTLDVHVSSLRSKLGSAAVIEAVRGIGYRLGTTPPLNVDASEITSDLSDPNRHR